MQLQRGRRDRLGPARCRRQQRAQVGRRDDAAAPAVEQQGRHRRNAAVGVGLRRVVEQAQRVQSWQQADQVFAPRRKRSRTFASGMSWPPLATRRRTRSRCRSTVARPTNQTLTAMPFAAARSSSSAIVRPPSVVSKAKSSFSSIASASSRRPSFRAAALASSCVSGGDRLRVGGRDPSGRLVRVVIVGAGAAQRRAADAALARAVAAGENEDRRRAPRRGVRCAGHVGLRPRPRCRAPTARCSDRP